MLSRRSESAPLGFNDLALEKWRYRRVIRRLDIQKETVEVFSQKVCLSLAG